MEMIEQRKRNRGQGGFTLIELLVVIAILAVLAGVAVFAVNGLGDDAGESACKIEEDTIRTAVEAAKATGSTNALDYMDQQGKYWTVTGLNYAASAENPSGDCTGI
jgi:prepilin-type N-terminal cleavage/methylation domain-containing protein